MNKIQMLDLSGQYQHIRTEIDEAIQAVIDTSAFIGGAAVDAFAHELATYTGARHVIPCGNCTDALQLSLMAAGLQSGDEVIVPAFTYIAAAEAVALLGLTPVWADVNADTFNVEPAAIEAAITPRTKAIIPVHLFGQAADMEPILQIAAARHLFVVEDAAQSIGATYTFANGEKKQCGTMGYTGCLSFFPSKNLGCFGDGGALLTNDADLAKRLKMLASHGQSTKYRHEIVGCNSRLDTIQAAILRVKLKHLNDYTTARQQVARRYHETLSDLHEYIALPASQAHATHVYHQYTIRVNDGKRDALKAHLQERGVPSMIYYPLSLPDQPVFSQRRAETPVARRLAESVLSLPIHTEMTAEEITYIAHQIKTFFL